MQAAISPTVPRMLKAGDGSLLGHKELCYIRRAARTFGCIAYWCPPRPPGVTQKDPDVRFACRGYPSQLGRATPVQGAAGKPAPGLGKTPAGAPQVLLATSTLRGGPGRQRSQHSAGVRGAAQSSCASPPSRPLPVLCWHFDLRGSSGGQVIRAARARWATVAPLTLRQTCTRPRVGA